MLHLLEHEFGRAAERIGFPSVMGCHAIVVLTETGLYGFHNAGGSAEGDWTSRATNFAEFCKDGRGFERKKALALYGVTFVKTNQRGYTLGSAEQLVQSWTGELQAFAKALGLKCPIYGFDLADRGYTTGTSAYIEFRKVGGSCIILVQPWNKGDATTAPRQPNRNHARRLGKNTNRTDVVSHGAMHGRLASRVTPARLA